MTLIYLLISCFVGKIGTSRFGKIPELPNSREYVARKIEPRIRNLLTHVIRLRDFIAFTLLPYFGLVCSLHVPHYLGDNCATCATGATLHVSLSISTNRV